MKYLKPSWIAAGLFVYVLALYSKVLSFDFVNYDDMDYVVLNKAINQGFSWEGLRALFSTHFLFGLDKVDYWAPVANFSHMLDFQIYGNNPAGHHLTNVIIHALNTSLVFLLLNRLTTSIFKSWAVATCFSAHPLVVESVCWIVERKGLLACLFGLMSLYSYVRYSERFRFTWLILSLFLFEIGLMAKMSIVPLPFILIALDFYVFERRKDLKMWTEKAVFVGLSAAATLQSVLYMQKYHNVASVESNGGMFVRLKTVLFAYFCETSNLIFPFNLSIFYPHPGSSIQLWQLALSLLLFVAVAALLFSWRSSLSIVPLGVAWFSAMLLPFVGIVQVGNQWIADRYAYMPMIGAIAAIVWGVQHDLKKWVPNLNESLHMKLVMIAFCFFGVLGIKQQQYWQNSQTLFQHAVEVNPRNALAHNQYGLSLFPKNLDEAEIHFNEAIKIKPEYSEALNNLGLVYELRGKTDDALDAFLKASKYSSKTGKAYLNTGRLLIAKGRNQEAPLFLLKASQLSPDLPEIYFNLALAYLRNGEPKQAKEALEKANKLKPNEGLMKEFNEIYKSI